MIQHRCQDRVSFPAQGTVFGARDLFHALPHAEPVPVHTSQFHKIPATAWLLPEVPFPPPVVYRWCSSKRKKKREKSMIGFSSGIESLGPLLLVLTYWLAGSGPSFR